MLYLCFSRFLCLGSLVEFSLRFNFSPFMDYFVFYSVVLMEPNLDDPGFASPLDPGTSSRAPLPPSGSSSSSEGAVEVRRNCLHCHRRMSKKTFDRHFLFR